jgi:signal transduction histidine kinase
MDFDSERSSADADTKRLMFARLADYLEEQQTAVTDQWLLAVRRDPEISAADRLTHQQLVDHLPDIYRECCAFLRTRDAAALIEGAKNDAKTHGGIRWADGYEIDELIRELEVFRGILGGTISRYGDIDPRFRGQIEASASALVQRFFGEVTVNSVVQYAQEQESVVATYTRELEAANLELARANAGLHQALSERERLTTVIAHEVRNFLQGLQHAKPGTRVASKEDRDEANAQLREVEDLLTQLLDHSALIAKREPLATAEFEPASLHDELTHAYRPAAERKGLTFIGSYSDAPKRVVGDRAKINRIASNLLSNALKYTHEGHVSLTFGTYDADRWVIRIADSGPGLNAQATQRLFGELARNEESVPRGGIGLAITKDLVELLSGSIQVVTKTGAGTVIEILLPLGMKST